MFYILFYCFLLTTLVVSQEEIFVNPGFEDPLDGSDWSCLSCGLTQDTDAYSGQYSGRTSNRNQDWSTVSQNVPLQANTYYYFSIYVKLLEMSEGVMWHRVNLQIEVELEGGGAQYINLAETPYFRLNQGWQKMGGEFYIGSAAATNFRAYIQPHGDIEGRHIDYLVDEASLTAFYPNSNWKVEAYERINQIRKNDITVNVIISGNYQPADIQVLVNQTSQSFPFGSAVKHDRLATDSDYNVKYQDTFYQHFNWAVMEYSLKWEYMEKVKGEIKYPDESIRRLNERGVPVRGHCVFWGKENQVPEWLKPMSPVDIEVEIQRRIDYVVTRYVKELIHWDVNNEQEHGPWFESALSNPTYMNNMFTDVRARDQNVTLFLNEYGILSYGLNTQSYINKAIEVHEATGQVGGIGAQSHISGYPDITSLQKRLEITTAAGFPVWITELDIEIEDRDQRANAYDDVTTLYYSQPGVEGILLWGFHDQNHWKPNCALFEGDNFEPNAAGVRWQEMMFDRWRSQEMFYPQSSEETFGFSGFHGGYNIQVSHNGEVILNQEFELPANRDITVDVNV